MDSWALSNLKGELGQLVKTGRVCRSTYSNMRRRCPAKASSRAWPPDNERMNDPEFLESSSVLPIKGTSR